MKIVFINKWRAGVCLLTMLISASVSAQNVSNRGTDFWVGYMGHIDGLNSNMSLYLTCQEATSGVVSIPLQGWSVPFTITPNAVTVVSIPPATGYVGCSDCIQDKGIHITCTLPIDAYAHIFASDRSDASLVLPVPALGKEYYVMAFTQNSGGYSEFLVVATEDSTQVEITPAQNTLNGHSANVPFTVMLNQGEIYQVQSSADLTGSHVVSYSSGSNPCSRIAVFSGSTWCSLGCSDASTADNLYQQLYPSNVWGNSFITAPFKTRIGGDYFRVFADNDNTAVTINGGAPAILNRFQFLDTLIAVPSFITSTKPVTLTQFMRTQNCDNVIGDPSMVIQAPVNQMLDTVGVYSTPKYLITGQYINVILKTPDTALFRLDNNHESFIPVAANPAYSYSLITVDSGYHGLTCDSGFIAYVYGFGDLESYGYCAGATTINLSQQIAVTSGGRLNPDTVCVQENVNFSGILSYTPYAVNWNFGDGDTASSLSPVHAFSKPGKYTIYFITTVDSGSCSTQKDTSKYVLNVVSPPVADFSFILLCHNDSVQFIDSTHSISSVVSLKWYFGDGDSSSIQNPVHGYPANGNYRVILTVNTSAGCSSEILKSLVIQSSFASAGPDTVICPGQKVQLKAAGGTIYNWLPDSTLSNSHIANPVSTVSANTTYTVTVVDSNKCSENKQVAISVYPLPVITISRDTSVCMNQPVTLTATGTDNLEWKQDSVIVCSNCSSYAPSTTQSASYSVIGTDANGCTETAEVMLSVKVCENLSVPTAFSPNGNGKNDLFRPLGVGISTIEFSVYDRWGQKIFTGNDLTNGWNGKYNGHDEPVGVYIWELKAILDNGNIVEQKGNVTLLR